MLPRFKYQILCEPENTYGDGFYRIYIQDEGGRHVVQMIPPNALKNKSFNDYMWKHLREEFERLIERRE